MTTDFYNRYLSDMDKEGREIWERRAFGCPIAVIDETLAGKDPRELAMYAMSVLSDAQELIWRAEVNNSGPSWSIAPRDADVIRQLMNVAKYAVDKAVPREASDAIYRAWCAK